MFIAAIFSNGNRFWNLIKLYKYYSFVNKKSIKQGGKKLKQKLKKFRYKMGTWVYIIESI